MEKEIVYQKGNLEEVTKSLEPTLAIIQQLQGGGRLRLGWSQLREIFDKLTEGHFWIGYPLPPEFLFFRGRIDNEVDRFDNAKQLSFRPVETVRDYGRCHRPGFSVFYGSDNLDTVLSELDPEIGDKVHVSVARLKKDKRRLNLTAVGEIERVRRYKSALIGNQLSRQIIEEFLKRLESESPSEADIKLLLLDAFFAELFFASARRQKDYKATSALSDIIFSMDKIDGFAYPSVAHHGGINFAIRSESFSESVEIIRCMSLRITNYLGFGIYGRLVYARSRSVSKDGIIEWQSV